MKPESNPFYPYEKIQDYATLPDADSLLKKIVDYLLDLPSAGYTPPDNNDFPRCRIMKLLFYDTSSCLNEALPAPKDKISLIFDPNHPDVAPGDKGYRIFPMIYPVQAQAEGQTTIKIFMGWAKATSAFRIDQSVTFEVMTNTAYEGNAGGYALSRTYDICTNIIRAFNGVNIDGVGTFYFDRRQHSECGMEPIADKSQNVGYRLTLALSYFGSEKDDRTLTC